MIPWPDYRAHETLIAPARPSAAIWRLLLGMIVVAVAYIALGRMFFQLALSLSEVQTVSFYESLFAGNTPWAMYLLLGSFAFMTLAVWVSVRLMHHRTMRSVLGPATLFRPQFALVLAALTLLSLALVVLPPWGMGSPYLPNVPLERWALLLPFSLLAVLVQVSAEEILFRGYIQQQLAARFRSPLVWMVLPSVLFALGHYVSDGDPAIAVMITVWAGVFGILMADITARAGSLGPAIAIHLWNNATAIVFLSMPDEMSGLALYHLPFGAADAEQMRAWLPVDFLLMLVAWLTARLAIRR